MYVLAKIKKAPKSSTKGYYTYQQKLIYNIVKIFVVKAHKIIQNIKYNLAINLLYYPSGIIIFQLLIIL